MKEFIEYIARHIVDKPDKVIVEETHPEENTIELLLKVDEGDIGKVIGKRGNTVNALRALLSALGGKEHHRVVLKIFDSLKDTKK